MKVDGNAVPDFGKGRASLNERKGRYGVAYLKTLCAQAGYGLNESAPGEDWFAIDCHLAARPGVIRLQVKCTTRKFAGKDEVLTWPVKPHWRDVWSANVTTIYFIVVQVSSDACSNWVEHTPLRTSHKATAYWVGIDPKNIPTTLRVAKSSRLTAETFSEWESALLAGYGASV